MIIPLVAHAGYVLAVQLVALLSLDPAEYGSFSLLYLAFALGTSLTLSIVSEAWVRRENVDGARASWDEYARAGVVLAAVVAVATLLVSSFLEPLQSVAILGTAAVFLATFRSAARYHDARAGRKAGVTIGDLAGLVVTGVGAVLMVATVIETTLTAVVGIWALSAAASVMATRPFRIVARQSASWVRTHRQHIRPLLRDSLLLDAGSIGTPLLLAPLLGLTGFGIYRAVSNVAAPVRLVLNPLRPIIAERELSTLISRRRSAQVVAVSVLFGVAAAIALILIAALPVNWGVLSALGPYAAATGLFVAANFLGHYSYIVCRAHATGRQLLTGRIVQTITAVGFPIVGFFAYSLTGAIWGYAVCTTASAIYWMHISRSLVR